MNLETERLILRHWKDDDYAPLAALNNDVDVMEYMPKPLTFEESNGMADKLRLLIEQRGWGMWALERKADGMFMGFTGLHVPKEAIPFSPGVEIGWRLESHSGDLVMLQKPQKNLCDMLLMSCDWRWFMPTPRQLIGGLRMSCGRSV